MQTILIDSNSICHKARYKLGELNNETMKVGVIFGFFMQLLKIAKDFETSQFAFFWDSEKSHRLKLYPNYKERRRTKKESKTPEEIEEDRCVFLQFDLLYEKYLPSIGFKNNYKESGFEADDLIASAVNHNLCKLIIVSGDEDLYQCLYTDVSILKNKSLFTMDDFKKVYGIDPTDWWLVKAIAGCNSDDVEGIRGVGEVKAIQHIKAELPVHHKVFQSIISPEGKMIIKRNTPLVKLPFKNTPEIILKKDKVLSLDGFMEMCNELDFQYFLKKDTLKQFKTHLNMR